MSNNLTLKVKPAYVSYLIHKFLGPLSYQHDLKKKKNLYTILFFSFVLWLIVYHQFCPPALIIKLSIIRRFRVTSDIICILCTQSVIITIYQNFILLSGRKNISNCTKLHIFAQFGQCFFPPLYSSISYCMSHKSHIYIKCDSSQA